MKWALSLLGAAAEWAAAKLRRDTANDEARDAATRERQRREQAAGAAYHRTSRLDHRTEGTREK